MDAGKQKLYTLILGQLIKDGFNLVANSLSEATQLPIPTPSQDLEKIVSTNLPNDEKVDEEMIGYDKVMYEGVGEIDDPSTNSKFLDFDSEGKGIGKRSAENVNFVTRFLSAHKNGCRVAKFSPNGKLAATGSLDASVKLMDVERMLGWTREQLTKVDANEDLPKPLLRTFYDHTLAVNDLDFHPVLPLLASCSKDTTIKFYDLTQLSQKRAVRFIQESSDVRSINFHPNGEFLLCGTESPIIRLYDLSTMKCYSGNRNPSDNHTSAINQVRYNSSGSLFSSCSKDGSIRIWDAHNHKLISMFPKAHLGFETTSATFTKNDKYLLSTGKDGISKLWEISTGRVVVTYSHNSLPVKNRLQSSFNWNEELVFTADENNSCYCWDARTGQQMQRITGHTNVIRWVASSPIDNSIITCSSDFRVRFWVDDLDPKFATTSSSNTTAATTATTTNTTSEVKSET